MKIEQLKALIERSKSLGIDFADLKQLLVRHVYLIRHAETPFNGDNEKIRSILDIPLEEAGLLQANTLGISLLNSDISCIYSSDMKRCKQTARAIQLNIGCDVEHLESLRSWNLGSLAGKKTSEVNDSIDDLIKNPNTLPPDSLESYANFKARNIKTYYELMRSEKTIAILTHYSNCKIILEQAGINEEIMPGQAIKLI